MLNGTYFRIRIEGENTPNNLVEYLRYIADSIEKAQTKEDLDKIEDYNKTLLSFEMWKSK